LRESYKSPRELKRDPGNRHVKGSTCRIERLTEDKKMAPNKK